MRSAHSRLTNTILINHHPLRQPHNLLSATPVSPTTSTTSATSRPGSSGHPLAKLGRATIKSLQSLVSIGAALAC